MNEAGFEVTPFSGWGLSPPCWWHIRRHLRRWCPDVLHYNDAHALLGAGVAAAGLKIPARIAARRVLFPVRRTLPYRLFADRVVCVSQAVADVCLASGLSRELLRVVCDGVDPARVASGDRQRGRRALGAADDQLLLVTIGRLTECKGHATLLEALPAVFRRYPQALSVLAGDGELAADLRSRAARLGIEGKVRLLGFRHDVPDLIQAADLLVLPSHQEGLCSTLIDAMLAGRAIVTTSAGGIPELVSGAGPDGEPLAWVVPARDPAALAEAMIAALVSPDERALRAERAREHARQRFTADRMVEATWAVCAEVLDKQA
jgi:glycosyltransferase involved in cell wall biosynthesis